MKKLMSVAALAAMTMFAGTASAQGYVGGTVGFSNFSVDCPYGVSCDEQDTAYKIYGGFTVAPNVSIELAYIDFGGASFTAPFGIGSGGVDVSAFVFNGAYHWQFSPKWSGVGRLGLANVSADGRGLYGNASDSNIKLYGGFGIEYAVTKTLKIVGALDLTAYELRDDDGSVNAFSAGLQLAF